jgi:hypothetical protein
MNTNTTARPIHPKDAAVIGAAINRFLDAGIERFGEAGFIAALEAYMTEQEVAR